MTKVKWMGSSKAVIKVNEAWSFKGSNVKKKIISVLQLWVVFCGCI